MKEVCVLLNTSPLPLHDRAGVGKPSAEDDHENVIPDFEAAGAIGFIQGNGNGGGGRVAVAVEVDLKFGERMVEAFGEGLDDAQVGLVRDDASQVVDRQTSLFQGLIGCGQHRDHRLLEGFPSAHVEGIEPEVDIFLRHRQGAASAGHVEDFTLVAVATHEGRNDAVGPGAIAADGRPGAVAA